MGFLARLSGADFSQDFFLEWRGYIFAGLNGIHSVSGNRKTSMFNQLNHHFFELNGPCSMAVLKNRAAG